MKKTINTFIVLTFTFLASAAPGKKESKENSILKIGEKSVPTSEFKYVYNKNNANTPDAYSDKSIREYLDLYIKFKLKVREAEELGMDTAKGFISELGGYQKQLAQPYLTEKSVTDNLLKEAYSRLQEEVKAAHILLKVAPDAEPNDTMFVYNKIMDIRKKALAGESFEALAKKYSEDPSAQTNGGNLGYFTALQMVYPFEDAAYKTPVGEISLPARTRFGYHLIKVSDKRKSKGEVKVSHIMIRYAAGTNPDDSVSAGQKINEIHTKVKKGEKWDVLCNEFSEDFNSKAKGGELPAFSTGHMIPSFEEAAFKLTDVNEVSQPIQTPYGFHIIKLLEKKGVQKYEELESTLKTKISKDSRTDLGKVYLINRLKRENNLKEVSKALDYAYSKADTNLTKGKFSYNEGAKENKQVLFSIKDKKYTVKDFFAYAKSKSKKVSFSPKYYMTLLYKEYLNETLVSFEEANLESKYVDYKMLIKEYRDGILLFQLMDNKVWSKAIEDTAGLKKFYSENKTKYTWGRRANAVIYNAKDKQTLETAKSQLNNKYFEVSSEKGGVLNYNKAKSDIKSTELKKADDIINVLGRDKNYLIELTSTEIKGESPKPNLGKQRLDVLIKYLTSKGIDAKRILTKTKTSPKGTPSVSYNVISSSISSLEKSLNEKAPLTLQIKESKFQAGDDAIIDSFDWKTGLNETSKNDRYYLINIKEIIEPQPKTFEEAKGLIISDYQNFLEKEWVEGLKKKYPVSVNEDEVKNLIKK